MKVVVTEVVARGRDVGRSAFCEQAALMMLGSKVCRITGVVIVVKPFSSIGADFAFVMAVAFIPAVALLLIAFPLLLTGNL